MVAVTNMVDAALAGVLIAVWAQHRGGGAGLMGATAAVMSVGRVIGALFAAAAGHRLPRRLAFAVGFFVIGAPRFAVLGLDAPLWLVFAVLFVGGLGCGLINPILGAVQMERVPEHDAGPGDVADQRGLLVPDPVRRGVRRRARHQVRHQRGPAGLRRHLPGGDHAAAGPAGVGADEPARSRADPETDVQDAPSPSWPIMA